MKFLYNDKHQRTPSYFVISFQIKKKARQSLPGLVEIPAKS
jgi:hypothetical protein